MVFGSALTQDNQGCLMVNSLNINVLDKVALIVTRSSDRLHRVGPYRESCRDALAFRTKVPLVFSALRGRIDS